MNKTVRGILRYRALLSDCAVVVAGMGRCGTTLLYDAVRRRGLRGTRFTPSLPAVGAFRTGRVYKTHDFPPAQMPDNTRVIFLFGNPLDIVISTHRKINEWGRKHHKHLHSDLFQPNDSLFRTDSLRLREHFEHWYRPQSFPFLSIRYESLFKPSTRSAIEHFLGFPVPLPEFRQRAADWSTHPQRDNLWKLYGDLHQTVQNVDDVRVWQAYEMPQQRARHG